MKKRKLGIRIIAIFLCVLMVLSVVIIAASRAFGAQASVTSPDTGSGSTWIIFAVAGAVAIAVAAVCIITSKKKK